MLCKKCLTSVIEGTEICPNCGENLVLNSMHINHESLNTQIEPIDVKTDNLPKKEKKKTWIIWLVVGIVGGLVLIGICGFLLSNVFNKTSGLIDNINDRIEEKNNTFYAEGYDLNYSLKWVKTTIQTTDGKNKDVLMYGIKDAYIIPVGVSALSETSTVDFSTSNGKKELYDAFYEYWNNGDTKLFGGSDGFSILKDNTYYATMDYGTSKEKLNGKMYLIVNEDNNIIISIMSNITRDFDKNSARVLDIIKTINITTKYDNELADIMNSMSAWNKYSIKRQGTLAKDKILNGEWRILSDSDAYYIFKDGEYWWYKSLYDMNDNYWYGTTKVYQGKEGLSKVGLDENRVDAIVAKAGGKVTDKDIYTIILTPSKIISNGEDKSDTNITGEDWHFVWVIVDHGSEGLEGQLLNVKTAATSYYVKVKD